MLNKLLTFALVVSIGGLYGTGNVYAEGVVQSASKNAAKGAIKGLQQEVNSGEMIKGVKEVTKGMVDGVSAAALTMASQVMNQANVNRKALGNVAREVSKDAAAGALGATLREMNEALGKKADGPLADTLAATNERMVASIVRGVKSEMNFDGETTERLAAAAVRGAVSEMHFNFRVWPIALAFVLGGISSLLCGLGFVFLYILFQRRRVDSDVEAKTVIVTTKPAHGMV